jgi:hypothetical protein
MMAIRSSETSVFKTAIQRNNPQDGILQLSRRKHTPYHSIL